HRSRHRNQPSGRHRRAGHGRVAGAGTRWNRPVPGHHPLGQGSGLVQRLEPGALLGQGPAADALRPRRGGAGDEHRRRAGTTRCRRPGRPIRPRPEVEHHHGRRLTRHAVPPSPSTIQEWWVLPRRTHHSWTFSAAEVLIPRTKGRTMKLSVPWRPTAAVTGCAALVAAGALVATSGTPAHAATPARAATSADPVTITPNPWYAGDPFEGWGTSLVWMANATGGYPDALREQRYQMVFGEDGLDLNIARYNIGGENASDVTDYLRPGGAVDGYWAQDTTGELYGAATTVADRDQILQAWD